jgi:WD40 repeat protein
VTLWDMATGREAGRLDGIPVAIASMAFSPGGQTLAIAGGTIIDLWDWPGRRLRSRLESEAVAIRSVAFAPDGRSLAVAGRGRDQGRVWRYNLVEQPPSCDAGLTLDRGGVPRPNPNALQDDFRAVAYTPDGRRLVAVGISSVVIWDAATGVQQDFIDRDFDLHYDRLDISPDGRWLAIIGSRIPSFIDLGPAGP